MFKRIGLITNSGVKAIQSTLAEILDYLQSRNRTIILDKCCAELVSGHNFDIFDASELGEHCDLVIAIGGDGTVNECLRSLVNTNTALGVIPCGSGNGFAYHIGMERTTKKAIRQLKSLHIRTIDSCHLRSMNLSF